MVQEKVVIFPPCIMIRMSKHLRMQILATRAQLVWEILMIQ